MVFSVFLSDMLAAPLVWVSDFAQTVMINSTLMLALFMKKFQNPSVARDHIGQTVKIVLNFIRQKHITLCMSHFNEDYFTAPLLYSITYSIKKHLSYRYTYAEMTKYIDPNNITTFPKLPQKGTSTKQYQNAAAYGSDSTLMSGNRYQLLQHVDFEVCSQGESTIDSSPPIEIPEQKRYKFKKIHIRNACKVKHI